MMTERGGWARTAAARGLSPAPYLLGGRWLGPPVRERPPPPEGSFGKGAPPSRPLTPLAQLRVRHVLGEGRSAQPGHDPASAPGAPAEAQRPAARPRRPHSPSPPGGASPRPRDPRGPAQVSTPVKWAELRG